jgi:prevent-host-death family protein
VRRVEIADATASLSEYARALRRQPVVVMRRGKPVAALMPIDENDWEDMVVGTHPAFIALIERSRARYKAGQGVSFAEIKRKYGIRSKPARRRSRRSR